MRTLYVIEARDDKGSLSFAEPQPESLFGHAAITGLDDDAIAKAIFRKKPDAVLDGRYIAEWPTLIDPRWKARPKTW